MGIWCTGIERTIGPLRDEQTGGGLEAEAQRPFGGGESGPGEGSFISADHLPENGIKGGVRLGRVVEDFPESSRANGASWPVHSWCVRCAGELASAACATFRKHGRVLVPEKRIRSEERRTPGER